MKLTFGLTLAGAVVVLVGCAHFQSKPLLPDKTAAELENRSLTNISLKLFLEENLHRELGSWPVQTWDLETLTFAALYYHPSLDVARAQWRLAQAGIKTAAGRLNPTITSSVGFDNGIKGNFSPWLPVVSFDVPLETAGKRKKRIDTAGHLSEAARLNVATAAWQVRSRLRASLLSYVWTQQRVALLRRQVELQQDINKRLENELQAGAIAQVEVTAGRIALARAQADLADAQRLFAGARIDVADAIGVPATALEGLSLGFELPKLPLADKLSSAEARRAALQGRSDILSALAEYAGAQSALQVEIAKQYPDVHLTPGYLWNQGNEGDSEWELGFTIELPILNRNQGPIAEAQARRDAIAASFLALQAQVISQIDRATATYRASEANAAALSTFAAEEEKRGRGVEAEFQAGATDRLTVLNAALTLTAAKLAQLDALAQAQQAFGQLEDAVQRPLVLPPAVFQTVQRTSLP